MTNKDEALYVLNIMFSPSGEFVEVSFLTPTVLSPGLCLSAQ